MYIDVWYCCIGYALNGVVILIIYCYYGFNASMMNNNSCNVLCYVWCNVVNYDIILFQWLVSLLFDISMIFLFVVILSTFLLLYRILM